MNGVEAGNIHTEFHGGGAEEFCETTRPKLLFAIDAIELCDLASVLAANDASQPCSPFLVEVGEIRVGSTVFNLLSKMNCGGTHSIDDRWNHRALRPSDGSAVDADEAPPNFREYVAAKCIDDAVDDRISILGREVPPPKTLSLQRSHSRRGVTRDVRVRVAVHQGHQTVVVFSHTSSLRGHTIPW